MPFPAFIYFKNAPMQTSPHPSVSVRYLHYSIKMRRLILYVCMFICIYELSRSCHISQALCLVFCIITLLRFLCKIFYAMFCSESLAKTSALKTKKRKSTAAGFIRQRRGRQEANAGRIFSTGRPRRCAFSRSYVTRVSSSMNARSLSLALAQLTLYFLHILKNIS